MIPVVLLLVLLLALSGDAKSATSSAAKGGSVRLFSQAWVWTHTAALLEAWAAEYNEKPTVNAAALALSVAAVEGAGEVKGHPGLVAWGGVHSRAVSELEALKLADGGYAPCKSDALEAEQFLASYSEPGVGAQSYPGGRTEYLGCDHLKVRPDGSFDPASAFWVWLVAFPGATPAARHMLQRMNAHAVLVQDGATPDELAARMKQTYHYGATVEQYADALWPAYNGLRARAYT